ncbi:hypothetical protein [Dictyobacter formicarum]|uniref:Uncharacterized protein n=1 Tax=Dictyobacter formicarum TaxID=2778368 RepID=A0ABQ3V9X2_9CHLR|nr:hypothetical protein [Dictyobacter formicarum]GHO82603.1 hypothetical protein KSZ_06090 [Dictyobacter formicarum]
MDIEPLPSDQTDDRFGEVPLDTWGQLIDPEPDGAGLAGPFRYPATLHGNTPNFQVYYNPNLNSAGEALANRVLETCERDYKTLSDYFGNITPPGFPCNVIIASEITGAWHADCKSTDIYCQAITKPGLDIDATPFALAAEIIEVFSAAQASGWDCESSAGEGLSRVLAAELYPAELGIFATAAVWLNTPSRPDFVNVSDPTDRHPISTGCSVLFLNYLHYQLGFTWKEIIQAGAPTLAQTYANLIKLRAGSTASGDVFQQFKTLLQAYFPVGTPTGLKNDNPFPLPPPGTTAAASS